MEEEQKANTYEISFLVDSPDNVQVVMRYLTLANASIVSEGVVSEIKLAYPIGKKQNAHFGYVHFVLDKDRVPELNEALRLDKTILRYLIITPPPQKPIQRSSNIEADRPSKPAASAEPLSNEALGEELAALTQS